MRKSICMICVLFLSFLAGCDGGCGDACDGSSAPCAGNEDCPFPNEYCAKDAGDCEGMGRCKLIPAACIDQWDPVCACDGRTYSNDCYAAGRGLNVAYPGECCSMDECGPQPKMPNYLCEDGVTMAGPGPCLRNEDGICGWRIVECP